MAVTTSLPISRQSPSSYWGSTLFSPPGSSLSRDGELLVKRIRCTQAEWRERSEYVANLGNSTAATSARQAVGVMELALLAVVPLALLVIGIVSDLETLFLPIAGVAGLLAFAGFARWVARNHDRNRLTRLLERVRRALAYEG